MRVRSAKESSQASRKSCVDELVEPHLLYMKRAAFLRTLSVLPVLVFVYGAHMILAYSRIGLFIVLYASSFVFNEEEVRVRRSDHRDFVAFVVTAFMWLSQVSLPLTIMPKYLYSLTILRVVLSTG